MTTLTQSEKNPKLKVGRKVESVATKALGKIEAIRKTKVGEFIDVNFGDKKSPQMRACRPSQIVPA